MPARAARCAEPAREQLRAEADADRRTSGARRRGEQRRFAVERRIVGRARAAEHEHEIIAGAVARRQRVAGPGAHHLEAQPAFFERRADEPGTFVLRMFDHESAHVRIVMRGRSAARSRTMIMMDGIVTLAIVAS